MQTHGFAPYRGQRMEDTNRMTLPDVARAAGVNYTTARAWATRGVVINGRRIRLGVECLGVRMYVTAAALAEFKRACGAARAEAGEPEPARPLKRRPRPKSASERGEAARRAALAELGRAG